MIKNIILDMGNVLLDFNPQISLDKYCKGEKEKNIIRNELFLGDVWSLADLGYIKDCERYERVKNKVPKQYWEALKNCSNNWDICMLPIKGAREFCQYIKEKGYGLYILSNASDKFYEYFPKFMSLDYFYGVVVSCDVKVIKPDKRIYEHILDKYKLLPQECLFIDDRLDNVIGGEKLGIKGEVFQNNFQDIIYKYNL